MSESRPPERRRSSAEPPYFSPNIGPEPDEAEGAHLRRVAYELSAADAPTVERLKESLASGELAVRKRAAASLGEIGSREAIAALRGMLEASDPEGWEVAVFGLRRTRERDGWLCLESVALESVPSLRSADVKIRRMAAIRLMMMGRTKTMDRLFRATDGHSKSIQAGAARAFVEQAIASIPALHGRVMGLRLGISGQGPLTPPEVAAATGTSEDRVRALESDAWAMLQSPRRWDELDQNLQRQ